MICGNKSALGEFVVEDIVCLTDIGTSFFVETT
jgi:hypothetical protein